MRSGAADQVRRASARPSTLLTRTRASTSDNIGLLARGPNSGGTFSPREPKSLMSAPSRRRNGALPTRRQASPWHLDGSLDAGNNGVASKCTIRRRRTIRAAQCTGAGDYPGAREVSAAHRVAALAQASKRSEAILCLRSQGRFSAVIGRLAHRTSVRPDHQLTRLIFDCAEPRSARNRGVCSLCKPPIAAARSACINTR